MEADQRTMKSKLFSCVTKNWRTIIFYFFLILIFLSTVVFVYKVIALYFEKFTGGFSTKNDDWGTFGDYIGGVLNPLFGALSFIALITTLHLQRTEIKEARLQFSRAANAQENSEKILREQAETFIKQQFESTFFSLLAQHNKAIEILSSRTGSEDASPIDIVYDNVFNLDNEKLEDAKLALEESDVICGHYFRSLYQILKFLCLCIPKSQFDGEFISQKIENSPLQKDEKMYSNIVRSYLRSDIAQLLAVNCYHGENHESYLRFKNLLERYALLEHMPFKIHEEENLVLLEAKSFYKEKAFGNSDYYNQV